MRMTDVHCSEIQTPQAAALRPLRRWDFIRPPHRRSFQDQARVSKSYEAASRSLPLGSPRFAVGVRDGRLRGTGSRFPASSRAGKLRTSTTPPTQRPAGSERLNDIAAEISVIASVRPEESAPLVSRVTMQPPRSRIQRCNVYQGRVAHPFPLLIIRPGSTRVVTECNQYGLDKGHN
jgi:hypothetical protein